MEFWLNNLSFSCTGGAPHCLSFRLLVIVRPLLKSSDYRFCNFQRFLAAIKLTTDNSLYSLRILIPFLALSWYFQNLRHAYMSCHKDDVRY